MKILTVFYSRTGNTKKIAKEIKNNLNSDIDEIKDEISRKGISGFLMGGKDAILKNTTKVSFKKNPSKYDLVIIGGPTWSFSICPAIRTYLISNKDKIKQIAFFGTAGTGFYFTFKDMERLSKKPLEIFKIYTHYKLLKNFQYKEKVKLFCDKIRKHDN